MAEAQGLLSGHKELAETNKAEQITSESVGILALSVKAKKSNAAVVYVGPSTINAEGYWLEAGESVEFDLIDPLRVYVYGKEKDVVGFLGLKP